MDTPSDNASGQPVERPFSVGVTLREARQRLGMSVADIASRLKFAPRQIEALEEDNFARLPESAFLRGFVRSYAKLLQLDPAPLLAALPQPPAQVEPPPEAKGREVEFRTAASTLRQNTPWLAGGLAVVVALGLFVWLGQDNRKAELAKVKSLQPAVEAETVPPAQEQAPAAEEAKAAAPSAPAEKTGDEAAAMPAKSSAPIHFVFDQDSWVEVTDKNGIYLMAQLNLAGTERRVRGNPPFSFTIGNASGVRLYYQGKQIDLEQYNRAGVAHLTLE